MQPNFITLPEMKVVGLGANFISILSPDKNNHQVIPELWHRFVQQESQIPHKKGASLGLVEPLQPTAPATHPGEMFYIAGVEVSDFAGAPPALLHRTIPAGRYASFTHVGPLSKLCDTMNFIYRQWLPQSKTRLRNTPHLEWYDHRFDPASDKSEFDILLPTE